MLMILPRSVVLVLILLLLRLDQAAGSTVPTTPDLAAVERFVAGRLAAHRIPGLALALTRGPEVVTVQGYGVTGTGAPVTAETQFLTASLSKSFTATAVPQLVERGLVDLDQPVRRYLPEFGLADPAVAAAITVRQLLNQTSGLADVGFASGLAREQAIDSRSPSERSPLPQR